MAENFEYNVLNQPNIYNVTMTNADTEYLQSLPAGTKRFSIKCRGNYDMKLSFTQGESGTKYVTIPAGFEYNEQNLRLLNITLYFQCVAAGQVAEIVAWT